MKHAHRLISKVDPRGYSLGYSYDAANRRTALTISGPGLTKTIKYGYYDDDMPKFLSDEVGEADLGFDALGNLSTVKYPNGVQSVYSYLQPTNSLASIVHKNPSGQVLAQVGYGYDCVSDRTSQTTLLGTTNYGYDDLRRLVSVGNPNGNSESFTYDVLGNRLSKHSSVGVINYSYDAASQLLQTGNSSYAYDGNGATTTKGASSFAYDKFGRLNRITPGTGSATSFNYNAFGQLDNVIKSTGTCSILYDGYNRLLDLDGSGKTTAVYMGLLGAFWKEKGANSVFYHFDGQGNVLALSNASGELLNTYAYEAFGKDLNLSSDAQNSLRFGGGLGLFTDDASGLVYMRARFYDPSIGRFLSVDPLALSLGTGLYAYAGNNPVNYSDPSGFDPVVGAIIGGISGGTGASRAGAGAGTVVAAVLVGALVGGIVGLPDISNLGAAAAAGAAGEATAELLTGQSISGSNMALAGVTGAVSIAAGGLAPDPVTGSAISAMLDALGSQLRGLASACGM
jgi:RHS repeat-associated protein